MTTRNHSMPDPRRPDEPEAKDKDENIVGHMLRTGLPPGVSPDESRDPGKQETPASKVVDNRS